MTDIFDTTIMCKRCGEEMEQTTVHKAGLELRAIECPKCNDKIIHPEDKAHFDQYNTLKGKTYHVKLRMVGNSHAISIPKEIVSFIQQQEKMMDDMVRLCFEDMRNLRIQFSEEDEEDNLNGR